MPGQGRLFEKGNQMGRGRPCGSRNKRTIFAEAMEGHGEAIIKQCQVLALKGDPTALRLCMDRLLPACPPSNNRFQLPLIKTTVDLGPAWQSVLKQVALGRLSVHEGEALAGMLENRRRAIEAEELDARLRAIEEKVATHNKPIKG
jgi:hypothetical protein